MKRKEEAHPCCQQIRTFSRKKRAADGAPVDEITAARHMLA
jgi:hypothetical protein